MKCGLCAEVIGEEKNQEDFPGDDRVLIESKNYVQCAGRAKKDVVHENEPGKGEEFVFCHTGMHMSFEKTQKFDFHEKNDNAICLQKSWLNRKKKKRESLQKTKVIQFNQRIMWMVWKKVRRKLFYTVMIKCLKASNFVHS